MSGPTATNAQACGEQAAEILKAIPDHPIALRLQGAAERRCGRTAGPSTSFRRLRQPNPAPPGCNTSTDARWPMPRRLQIGGRGPIREIGAPADIGYILRYARKLWPALESASWTHAWGGQLAITPDQLPHLHALAPGVWTCLGYSGRGVPLASALGAQLAQKIADPRATLDLPVTGIRPIAMHALWPLAVKAAVTYGRISDYFGL